MGVTTPIKAFSLEDAPQHATGISTSISVFDSFEYTFEERLGLCPSRSESEFLIQAQEYGYLQLIHCIIFLGFNYEVQQRMNA